MATPDTATEVGAYEAKTHLPRLLERVRQGESITITKHGTPVARLVPVEKPARRRTVSEAIEEIRRFRKSHRLDGLTIRELIEEGRR
jgi:prevent-host-death family protein